jgi:hypothetical protein
LIDPIKGQRIRAMNRNLVALFLFSMSLDLALAVTAFLPAPKLHAIFKPFVYSVNLKVEAVVLNNLASLIKSSSSSFWDLSATPHEETSSLARHFARSPTIGGGRRPSFVRSLALNDFRFPPLSQKTSTRETFDTVALMDVTKWGVYSRRPTYTEGGMI